LSRTPALTAYDQIRQERSQNQQKEAIDPAHSHGWILRDPAGVRKRSHAIPVSLSSGTLAPFI